MNVFRTHRHTVARDNDGAGDANSPFGSRFFALLSLQQKKILDDQSDVCRSKR